MVEVVKRGRGRPRKEGRRKPCGRLVPPRKPKPEMVVSDDQRLEVEQMAALGESHSVIAEAFGTTTQDLLRSFSAELEHGPARRRREIIGLMFAKARTGSPPVLERLMAKTGAVLAEKAMGEDGPRTPRLGKKEEAALAAETAGVGTDWAEDLDHEPARAN